MNEYQQIVVEHVEKLRRLRDEQARIEQQIKSVRDLLKAALNLMPEEEKGPFMQEMGTVVFERVGLTQAIRNLMQGRDSFLTPPEIKDMLEINGYDFSEYKSNPLSSIHSILKRFKRSEMEVRHWATGTPSYRWKKKRDRKTNQK
jgi:hypothetical protein